MKTDIFLILRDWNFQAGNLGSNSLFFKIIVFQKKMECSFNSLSLSLLGGELVNLFYFIHSGKNFIKKGSLKVLIWFSRNSN